MQLTVLDTRNHIVATTSNKPSIDTLNFYIQILSASTICKSSSKQFHQRTLHATSTKTISVLPIQQPIYKDPLPSKTMRIKHADHILLRILI